MGPPGTKQNGVTIEDVGNLFGEVFPEDTKPQKSSKLSKKKLKKHRDLQKKLALLQQQIELLKEEGSDEEEYVEVSTQATISRKNTVERNFPPQ